MEINKGRPRPFNNEQHDLSDEPFARPAHETKGFNARSAVNELNKLYKKYNITEAKKTLIYLYLKNKNYNEALNEFYLGLQDIFNLGEDRQTLENSLRYIVNNDEAIDVIESDLPENVTL